MMKNPLNNVAIRYNGLIKGIIALCLVTSIFVLATPGLCQNINVAGWIEKVKIYPGALVVKAKLDTGARNSSLNAKIVEQFGQDGKTWIRFEVYDHRGRKVTFEKKIHRIAKIKLRSRKIQERPVVKLGICLGQIYKEVEINLVDRSYFNYQMLLGRNFLAGAFLVDSGTTFNTKPDCQKDAGHE
jgi:hypothetical protein